MSKLRRSCAAAVGAAALLAAGPMSAQAETTGTTDVTFALKGGELAITVQKAAPLSDGATGDTSVTGNLGPVTVTDTRGGTEAWTSSAASTTFTSTSAGGTTTSSTAVTYDSGSVDQTTGTVSVKNSPDVDLSTKPATVVSATEVSGNNTATWYPTLTVSLPESALAGDYTGTITTSVA